MAAPGRRGRRRRAPRPAYEPLGPPAVERLRDAEVELGRAESGGRGPGRGRGAGARRRGAAARRRRGSTLPSRWNAQPTSSRAPLQELVERRARSRPPAATCSARRVERGIDRTVEDQRAHASGNAAAYSVAEVGAVREAEVRQLVVAERGADPVEVAHRVLGGEVRQQRPRTSPRTSRRASAHRRRARRAPVGRRARSRGSSTSSRLSSHWTGALSPDAPRVEADDVEAVADLRREAGGGVAHEVETPDAPGPPGLTSSEPMRWPGRRAGTRISARSTVGPPATELVERDGQRRALDVPAGPPASAGTAGRTRPSWPGPRSRL